MSEAPIGSAAPDAFVSVDLAARVAGISRNDMQRIAAGFAKGSAEPWFGAVLDVRTERVLGRRHRDLRISSLPDWMRQSLETRRFRFLLAAEQVEPGAELGPADYMLLHRAGQDDFAERDFFDQAVRAFCAGGTLLAASRERFDLLMDNFYGWGFRDPALPGVSPDYLEFLDRSRRHLGMSDRYYAAVLMELGGVDRPRHLDGAGFVRIVDFLRQRDLPWTLPERRVMDRTTVGIINEASRQLGIPYADHLANVTMIGGGAVRPQDLDVAGWCRLRSFYLKAGYRGPSPAPRVPGGHGFVSQAQANLIWRLWCLRGGEPAIPALDSYCGGSFYGLTQAGVRTIMDGLLAPLIDLRLLADKAWRNGPHT